MKKLILLVVGATADACNPGPQVHKKNASVAEIAKKVGETSAAQNFVRAGLWEAKATVEQLDVPGLPPEMAERMKDNLAEHQPKGFQTCLTPEDVERPKEAFFAGKSNQCRYDHFDMGDGKVDALMHCGGERMAQTMQMNGTYSPDNYVMHISTKMQGTMAVDQEMTMRMRIDARRVGECAGKQG